MPYFDEENLLPNKEHFEEVYAMLKSGTPLDLTMLHYIFGRQFFQLLTLSLIDAKQSMKEK